MFAIYKKELRSYYTSPFAYLIAALFMLIFTTSFADNIANLSGQEYKFSFSNIFYNNFFYFIFLIPLLTMRIFAEERKSGTEVLLMTKPVSIFQIVMAKFLAVSTVFLTMMILTFFYPIITVFTGGVMWSSLICGYIGFFMWGLVCISIGMLISSFTDNPIIAAVISESAMLLLLTVDNFKNSGLFKSLPKAAEIIGAFSTQERFENFSQGIFGLADFIFFVTVTMLFIGLTVISVLKRRWSRG